MYTSINGNVTYNGRIIGNGDTRLARLYSAYHAESLSDNYSLRRLYSLFKRIAAHGGMDAINTINAHIMSTNGDLSQ